MKALSLILAVIAVSSGLLAQEPTANISITFTPKEGAAVTVSALGANMGAGAALPINVPNAVRLVEVHPWFDYDSNKYIQLDLQICDPSIIIPSTPGWPGGSTGPTPPHPLILMHSMIRFETDKDIIFFKSTEGDWSVKVGNVTK